MKSQISIVKCESYDSSLVIKAVRKAVDLIGGITSFIKPHSRVLVKPNLLAAAEPETGIDTHPEVVRAVVKILKEINCKVYLGDGPSVWGRQQENADEVYEKSGMKKMAYEEGVELVKFDKRRWRGKFPLTTWLDTCDSFVSIPKLKTHEFTVLTAAIKNLFGLVTGTYKTELHKNYFKRDDFSGILVDIYAEARPCLTIVDGIVAMEGDGPATSGKLRNLNLLLAGLDCVALDSVISIIMGLKPLDILTTKEAARRGLGVANVNDISVFGEKLEDVVGRPFILPKTSMNRKIPQPIIDLARKLIKYYPCVEQDNCVKCATCLDACPKKAISIKNERIVIDRSKCISCFCCLESCPASAIKVEKSFFTKLIGL